MTNTGVLGGHLPLGFVIPNDGSPPLFYHPPDNPNVEGDWRGGEKVFYDKVLDSGNMVPKAVNVRYIAGATVTATSSNIEDIPAELPPLPPPARPPPTSSATMEPATPSGGGTASSETGTVDKGRKT